MDSSSDQYQDIDLLISTIQQRIADVQVTQWHKNRPSDDDHLWFFALPQVKASVQVEGTSCPFLIETDDQSSKEALKARTVGEAASLVVNYLTAARLGQSRWLKGELYWPR